MRGIILAGGPGFLEEGTGITEITLLKHGLAEGTGGGWIPAIEGAGPFGVTGGLGGIREGAGVEPGEGEEGFDKAGIAFEGFLIVGGGFLELSGGFLEFSDRELQGQFGICAGI